MSVDLPVVWNFPGAANQDSGVGILQDEMMNRRIVALALAAIIGVPAAVQAKMLSVHCVFDEQSVMNWDIGSQKVFETGRLDRLAENLIL